MSVNPGDAEVIRLRAIFEDLARADIEQLRRALGGLDREGNRLNGTFRDSNGRLRTLNGRFAAAGAGARVLEGRLAGVRREANRMNRALSDSSGYGNRVRASTVLLGAAITALVSIIPGIVPLAGYLGAIAAAAVTAIPPAVAAIGTLALAFAGVGDAVSALASGDLDKINEAFRNLTPAGQVFAQTLLDLKPVLDGLRAAAQDGLLPGVGDALNTLASGLGPTLERVVDAYSTGLGELARQFSASLISPEAVQFFDYLIQKASELDIFGQVATDTVAGVANLVQSLEPLSQVGVEIIAGLASSFRSFADTVDFAPIAQYVQDTLPQVQRFFGAFNTLTASLFQALAPVGPEVLDVLSDFFLEFAAQGPAITSIFRLLLATLDPVLDIIAGPLLSLLGAFADATRPLITRFGGALLVAATKLGDTLEGILPELSDSLLGLLDSVLPVADSLLDELLPVLPIAADLITGLIDALGPVIPLLGDALTDALAELVPYLPALVDSFLDLVEQLPQLVPTVVDLFNALLPLAPQILDLANSTIPAITAALVEATPDLIELSSALTDTLIPVIDQLVIALQGWTAIMDLLSGKTDDTFGGKASSIGLNSLINAIPGVGGIRAALGLAGAIGDTTTSHRGGSMIGNTLAWTSAAMGLVGGGAAVSNLFVGGGGYGPSSGDHEAGAAVDLTGRNASRIAALANATGGYGAMHGFGASRHAHVVPGNLNDLRMPDLPMGDTLTSQRNSYDYGQTININAPGATPETVAALRAIARSEFGVIRRDLSERQAGSAF